MSDKVVLNADFFTIHEAVPKLVSGKITQSVAIIGILMLEHLRKKGEL